MAFVSIRYASAVYLSVIVLPVTAKVESRGLLDLIDTNVSCGTAVTVTFRFRKEILL